MKERSGLSPALNLSASGKKQELRTRAHSGQVRSGLFRVLVSLRLVG